MSSRGLYERDGEIGGRLSAEINPDIVTLLGREEGLHRRQNDGRANGGKRDVRFERIAEPVNAILVPAMEMIDIAAVPFPQQKRIGGEIIDKGWRAVQCVRAEKDRREAICT